ncbi:MAG TPA: CdaR family protein [Nitrospinota bacterium]|nr:CdaR family protein [Nitrospinota bacterium]
MNLGFLKKNLLLKILSLLFAILIWFIVTKEEKSILQLTVPLELKNLPYNLIISNISPGKIDLRIQGSKSTLANLATGDVTVSLDISKGQIGKNRFFLRTENVKHPFGTEILLIEPSIIPINIQKKLQKIIPLRLNIEGKPKEGFKVAETNLEPKAVTVAGPEKEVEKIKEIKTETINVDNQNQTFTKEVSPIITSPRISLVTTEKIRAEVKIEEIDITRKFSNIPIKIIPPDFKVDYNPKTVDIILNGPPSIINSLDNAQIIVEINIAELEPTPKDYKLTPHLKFTSQVPKTVIVKKIIPTSIDLRIYSKK